MKTLHITRLNRVRNLFTRNESVKTRQQNLMKDLYKKFLKEDGLFHFFYEPEIIIRISTESVLTPVSRYLDEQNIDYEIYDYPTPKQNLTIDCYGEEPGGIVINNLDLFLPIFHAHAVAAITLNDDDHFHYMERVTHTMWNPRGYTRQEEGEHLALLASWKLDTLPEISSPQQSKRRCIIL